MAPQPARASPRGHLTMKDWLATVLLGLNAGHWLRGFADPFGDRQLMKQPRRVGAEGGGVGAELKSAAGEKGPGMVGDWPHDGQPEMGGGKVGRRSRAPNSIGLS